MQTFSHVLVVLTFSVAMVTLLYHRSFIPLLRGNGDALNQEPITRSVPIYWAVSPARLQMWVFLELKFPAKAVSIVPVVVSHPLAFSYEIPLFFETFVHLFFKKANAKFSHNISHSSKEA